jgi:hypothetical protein
MFSRPLDATAVVQSQESQSLDWGTGFARMVGGLDSNRGVRALGQEEAHRADVARNGMKFLIFEILRFNSDLEYERQQRFLRGLKVDPETMNDVRDQKAARFEDTCKWILDRQAYKEWKEGSGAKVLVVTAPPGRGKSVLAKYLLQTFTRTANQAGIFIILDYFCQGIGRRSTALTIVRSLLYQLLAYQRHLFKFVQQKYTRSVDRELELPFEALWETFVLILKSPDIAEVYCLIDGLDECENDSDRIFLKSVGEDFTPQSNNQAPSPNRIRFLVTSRPTTPATRLGRLSQLYEIQKSDLDEDIDKVIEFRIQKMIRAGVLSSQVSGTVELAVRCAANGMFLLVKLSLDQLEDIQVDLSVFDLLGMLRETPKDVREVYVEAMRRIQQSLQTRNLAKKILDILLFSFRPLTARAFAVACYDWPKSLTTHAQLSTRVAPNFENSIKTACSSFINFMDGTIQFCHYTAHQYLLSKDASLGSFSFEADQVHCYMARVCIRYLLLRDISIPEADENGVVNVDKAAFPLLDYALQN